ncbi:MAG: hypothetical protein ICV73_00750 [Acetobacteraceae bacterium]|nr:hypothetical protein [Acetobacteraceae bacterium]
MTGAVGRIVGPQAGHGVSLAGRAASLRPAEAVMQKIVEGAARALRRAGAWQVG